ncbi:retrovirus-related pol polyprotein from transposon TNT 1-94 [Tanacetum coccineum]
MPIILRLLTLQISIKGLSMRKTSSKEENFDDEVDERSSEEYLRDLDIKFQERAILANSKLIGYSSVSKGFQPKFTPKLIQSSQSSSSQADPKIQKDYKAKYKKMKAKLALLEASPSTSQTPKAFQTKNKCIVAKTFDWDEEEVLDDEEVTQVKVLMALANDELTVGKNHAQNAKLDVVTFQIQNTELTKSNHALQEQLKEEKKINEKWLTSSKRVSQCISEQIPHQKKKVLGGELFTESSSKMNENENLFIPASIGYDHEMVPKFKDWVERFNPDSKLPNFNTGRILVPERASPSSEVESLTFQPHSPKERPCLGIMKHTKPETQDSLNKNVLGTVTVSKTEPTTPSVPNEVKNIEQESKINELTKHVQMLINEKRHIREPIWYLDSGCSKSMTGVKSYLHKYVEQPCLKVVFGDNSSCITERYGSINCGGITFTKVAFVNGLKYNLISINQLCDAKYIVQFDDKQGTIFNANKEIVLIAPRRNDVYVLDMSSLTPNGACFLLNPQKVQIGFSIKGYHISILRTLINLQNKTRMVENQNDVKVRQIRTDNGTEFKNSKLKSFCNKKGISQNFSSPYTPEQNIIAERKNKTLIEATRTILHGSVLSKNF